MSSKLTKLFIDFTSDIVSSNSSLEFDEFKKTLMNKDVRQKFDEFLKNNKIKQKKEKKDPTSDEPKKPKSSYIIFCSAERDGLVESNPGVEHKEITSLLGQRWKDIQLNNKDLFQKYVDTATREKAEYEDNMKAYRLLHNIPEKVEKVKKPKVVKPEKAMSPFYYYCKDVESEVASANPDMKKKDVLLKIKADWKELKDEKDEVVNRYKKIAKDKKNELTLTSSSSVQTSPMKNSNPSSPVSHYHPLTPGRTPGGRTPEPSPSPLPEKKKKKKKSDEEKLKKKKKIRKVLESEDEEDDD